MYERDGVMVTSGPAATPMCHVLSPVFMASETRKGASSIQYVPIHSETPTRNNPTNPSAPLSTSLPRLSLVVRDLYWPRRRGSDPVPQHRPIPAPMHRAHTAGAVLPCAVVELAGLVALQGGIGLAEDNLKHVPETVLDVYGVVGPVHEESDADDVEAMELVQHRDEEGAVVWTEADKAVPGREDGAPVCVGEEGIMRRASLQHERSGG